MLFRSKKGKGYFYPLIDYGYVSSNKIDYYYPTLRPALYVREYIDKIITGAGYTYESDFFSTNFFKRLIIFRYFFNLFGKKFLNNFSAFLIINLIDIIFPFYYS